MPKNQYNSPAMEVVEFGKEDAVCTASGPNTWVVIGPDGKPEGGGTILPDTSSPGEW